MAFGQYGGYIPGVYQPGYYGQPMPDQLAQLRAMQQMPQPTPQAAQQSAGNGLLWVQGEAGAKSFMVAPGSSVLLMDSERNTFYIKSSDASGMPSMRTFDYTERADMQRQPAQQFTNEFVTRAEFDAFVARIDGQTSRECQEIKEGKQNAEPAV